MTQEEFEAIKADWIGWSNTSEAVTINKLLAEVERLRAELAEAVRPTDAEIIAENNRLRKANTAAIAALLTLANEENWENRGGHMTWIGSRGNRPMDFAWQAANNITDIEGGEG